MRGKFRTNMFTITKPIAHIMVIIGWRPPTGFIHNYFSLKFILPAWFHWNYDFVNSKRPLRLYANQHFLKINIEFFHRYDPTSASFLSAAEGQRPKNYSSCCCSCCWIFWLIYALSTSTTVLHPIYHSIIYLSIHLAVFLSVNLSIDLFLSLNINI